MENRNILTSYQNIFRMIGLVFAIIIGSLLGACEYMTLMFLKGQPVEGFMEPVTIGKGFYFWMLYLNSLSTVIFIIFLFLKFILHITVKNEKKDTQ